MKGFATLSICLIEAKSSGKMCKYLLFSSTSLNIVSVFRIHYRDYHLVPNSSHHWTMEYGYTANAGLDAYPRRALLAGATNGFTFNILTSKEDLDYACKNSLQGYRVMLHTPMRIPRPSQQYFRIPLDQTVVGAVQPVMITTSDSVKMYNPKRRQCYFPTERHLKYFRIYTSLNCLMECLTNYTIHHCGCVNFFMPSKCSESVQIAGRQQNEEGLVLVVTTVLEDHFCKLKKIS